VGNNLVAFVDPEFKGYLPPGHRKHLRGRRHRGVELGCFHMVKLGVNSNRRLLGRGHFTKRRYRGLLRQRQDPRGRQHGNITRAVCDCRVGFADYQRYFCSTANLNHPLDVSSRAFRYREFGQGGVALVKLTRSDQVFILTMDDGDNRMNQPWLDAMNEALDEVDATADAGALVTTGAEKFFSNGLDLEWIMGSGVDMLRFVADVERFLARVMAAPYITVAACNGHTFAAGAMLALCHDFRVMRSDRGFFCLPEVDIKIPFTPGMNSLIMSRMTITAAHEAMVTGKRFGGEEAARLHIVHHAVAADEVLSTAVAIAAEHGGKDRNTLGTIKERMYGETIRLLQNSPGTQSA